MSKKLTAPELVDSHRPKHSKYRYILKDDSLVKELEEFEFDISSLDTIDDDDLVQSALQCTSFTEYPRESVAKAKEPTVLDNGVVLSKQLATKTDKKLQNVSVGFFDHNNDKYVCIKLVYERFDIIELFIII